MKTLTKMEFRKLVDDFLLANPGCTLNAIDSYLMWIDRRRDSEDYQRKRTSGVRPRSYHALRAKRLHNELKRHTNKGTSGKHAWFYGSPEVHAKIEKLRLTQEETNQLESVGFSVYQGS